MTTATLSKIEIREAGANHWLSLPAAEAPQLIPTEIVPEIVATEEAVGELQLEELRSVARKKSGNIVILLLGGRGAQALHRKLGQLAAAPEVEEWFGRLHVFMQDALAPMPQNSTLNFTYDFRRLLGPSFFSKIGGFYELHTDAADLHEELTRYVQHLFELGGPDIFFLGHGPEANDASHLAYIRPGSGAISRDIAGLIPISSTILEHHISKFRAGGIQVSAEDEEQCRKARYILTMGPAVILKAKRIVQSIVDADTAPAKKKTYRRVLDTTLESDAAMLAAQLDENPGLWVKLHPSVRSLVLPNVLE